MQMTKAQYCAILDSMVEAIHIVDKELRIVLMSKAFRAWNKQLGLDINVLGKTVHEVYPFLPHETSAEYAEVFVTGRILNTEETFQLAGQELATRTRKIPVFEDGKVTQVITVVRDLTERRRAEAERERLLSAEREQRLQTETLREVAAALNTRLDLQQVLPLILEQLARVVRYDSASIMLLTGNILDLVAYRSPELGLKPSQPLRVEALPRAQQVIVGQQPTIVADTAAEASWQRLPGSLHSRCWMGVPLVVQNEAIGLLNLNHREPGFYSQHDAALASAFANQSATAIHNARLFDDLQRSHAALSLERAKLAQRVAERTADLSSANAVLARTSRLKDEFVSNVSHELRTPLSVITLVSGNLDRLYHRIDDHRRQEMIQEIREQARLLNDLIEDILLTSRIDSQRVSIERQILNLAELATSEAEKQLPLVQQKGQSLSVAVAQGLLVWGNEGQLRQAIRNVLNNAIKYTPSGGKVLCEGLEMMESTIPTSADWDETQGTQGPDGQAACETRWISLCVRDNGPGIHEDDVRHLFTRFYRADSQKEIPGTGLGLSIARELVELHGGYLTVTSTPGEGSTFTIYLPPSEGKHDKDERA